MIMMLRAALSHTLRPLSRPLSTPFLASISLPAMSSTGGPSRNTHRRRRGGGGAPALARGAATAAATAAAPARAPPVQQNLVVPAALPPKANDNLSTTRFAEFYQRRLISKNLLDNIPFEFCTEVQAATMDTILSGVDV